MTVTAKDTRAALRRHVVPLLREAGFGDGTPQKLWRHRGARIEHVELSCLSAYDAQVQASTTASFRVRIARCLAGYSALNDPFQRDYVKSGPKGPRPTEPQMPIRGVVCPSDAPPMEKGRWGWVFQEIWSVTSVEEAEAAAVDLRGQLERDVLRWLDEDFDLEKILALLTSDETSLFLRRADNGSHLKLDAALPGSQVRAAHLAMARAAMRHT